MNREIVIKARQMPNYNFIVAEGIDCDSYQIERTEAELIAAAIANPLKAKDEQTKLYLKINLPNDFLLKKPSTAFIFHVPNSYCKLIIVKPNFEINAVVVISFNYLLAMFYLQLLQL